MENLDRFKIKIWDILNNKFVKNGGNAIEQDGNLIGLCGIPPQHMGQYFNEININNFVIQQCTGLKDKNGKLIYEGDIIGGGWGVVIKHCNKCFGFQPFYNEGKECMRCMRCMSDVDWNELVDSGLSVEIIGNIHQNPELLK